MLGSLLASISFAIDHISSGLSFSFSVEFTYSSVFFLNPLNIFLGLKVNKKSLTLLK
jgi:hypothetical protein